MKHPLRALLALLCASCARAPSPPPLFELLPPSSTGVSFTNTLPEREDFNILNYLYYYNGGGVAVGDVNGDGLPDLYFTANLGPNRLYLNKGGFKFEDVTEKAGVADSVTAPILPFLTDGDDSGETDGVTYEYMREFESKHG